VFLILIGAVAAALQLRMFRARAAAQYEADMEENDRRNGRTGLIAWFARPRDRAYIRFLVAMMAIWFSVIFFILYESRY
jgi:hypothetical protein